MPATAWVLVVFLVCCAGDTTEGMDATPVAEYILLSDCMNAGRTWVQDAMFGGARVGYSCLPLYEGSKSRVK